MRPQPIRRIKISTIARPRLVKTVSRAGLSLFRRRFRASISISPCFNILVHSRTMSLDQNPSATPDENDSFVAKVANSSVTGASRSLSELARRKTAFEWRRPLPRFMATSSRGSIPHLTPDNLHSHTRIPFVHIGLEDFLNSPPQSSPILSIETGLQRYLAYPENTTMVLSARRANPFPINASWDDKIEIYTVKGRYPLPVETFINAVHRVNLRDGDIVVSIPDATEAPGTKRIAKMVERTQRWLTMLLHSNVLLPSTNTI